MGTSARTPTRLDVGRLAEEQAALRRVATLVAQGTPSAQVFGAVAREVAQVMHFPLVAVCRYDDDGESVTVLSQWSDRPHVFQAGTRWPLDGQSVIGQVLRTGRAARIEDYSGLPGTPAVEAREGRNEPTAGAPIVVDGRVWGVMVMSSPDAPLPDRVEHLLAAFTELAATAVSTTEAHESLGRLAKEQAALRRVATLVASGAQPAEVFDELTAEVGRLVGVDAAVLIRYESEEEFTVVGSWSRSGPTMAVGMQFPVGTGTAARLVFDTRRPARVDCNHDVAARALGWRSAVGAPVIVEGRIWGMVTVLSKSTQPLPHLTEGRLTEFTELVATAISNAESREELTRLVEEQAALRRVATLVAKGVPPAEVFEAVSTEVAQLLPAEGSALTRYENDGTVTAVSGWTDTGGYVYVGGRFALEGTVSGLILESRRPARIDNYLEEPGSAAAAAREMGWRSSVGAPITVEGRLWGALAVVSRSDEPLPPDTERRLADFTEHVATAIANAESREELTRLADEQASLRRVATLVARDAPPKDVFEAVSAEVGRLVPADAAALVRYETDGTVNAVGAWSASEAPVPVGTRQPLDKALLSSMILETRRPGRVDYAGAGAEVAAQVGWRSGVGAPVIVEGRLWGVIIVGSMTDRALPHGTEERLMEFTELLATAIANAESRAELDASRARIVTTADATRRRIERDLHDGAQQQLVTLALELRAAEATVPPELGELRAELSRVVEGQTSVLDELREIALGIHPAILAEGGLGPALKTLARRSRIPVELDAGIEGRLPEPVEVAAYYVVSEALTNAAKYAAASVVYVAVEARHGKLRVVVEDDGIGGADPAGGSGLQGLKDRAEAIGGTMSLESPAGSGTSLRVELPLDDPTR
ncbi:MAG TPA: GAF domain-containing protein [Gaiellaceae bacterium]|nr:GAF domain-containing protein [Gaiellaceae bacterium]